MKKRYNREELETAMDAVLRELESHESDEILATRAYNSVISRLGLFSFKRSFRHFLSAAVKIAAVLFVPLSVCFTFAMLSHNKETQWAEVIVPAGQKYKMTLADGTRLTLNAGTRLTYPLSFDGKSRELFLDGEVHAEVARDEKKPFIIHAGDLNLKVLGTKFDMKAYSLSQKADVFLQEGSVLLSADSPVQTSTLMLSSGQHAQFDRNTCLFELENYDKVLYQSFTNTTTLSFHKIKMHDVAIELQRIFGREIVITDHKLAEKRILAYFSNGEGLEDILEAFNFDGQMKIDIQQDIIYLSSK